MINRSRGVRGIAAAVFGLALAAGYAPPSWAQSEKTLAYPREQVWPAAVRFLVVDEHVKVTDKDSEAGYVMFELRDDGKTYRGALELASVTRDGRPAVRFMLQIEDRPSWLEIVMLRRLEAKLHVELGAPAPAPDQPKGDKPRDDKPKDDKAPPTAAPPPADDAPKPPSGRDEGGVHISPTP